MYSDRRKKQYKTSFINKRSGDEQERHIIRKYIVVPAVAVTRHYNAYALVGFTEFMQHSDKIADSVKKIIVSYVFTSRVILIPKQFKCVISLRC